MEPEKEIENHGTLACREAAKQWQGDKAKFSVVKMPNWQSDLAERGGSASFCDESFDEKIKE